VDVVSRFLATAHPLAYLAAASIVASLAVVVILWRDDLADQRRRADRAAAVATDAERRRARFAKLTARQDFKAWERELWGVEK
jgi:hypothetical protein